jgi:Ca2+-transporting ATPase
MDGPPAMSLGVDPPPPGIMSGPPRKTNERILTVHRFGKLASHGVVMMAGTLGMLWWGLQNGSNLYAQTMAFTTFVLFQIFNAFNARVDEESTFNVNFFRNRILWLALAGVVILQVVAVQWAPIKGLFDVEHLSITDWLLATSVASSVLVIEELRKYLLRVFGH